jgi:peptidoglycan-associated lipoprotein
MVMGVSCAKKVVTEQQEPAKAAPAAPAPAAKEEPKAAPTPLAPDKFAEAKKVFEADGIYFDFDKYNLKPEAIQALDKKVGFLKEYPQVKVLIAGNCDPRGSNEYNLALGDRRANAAKSYGEGRHCREPPEHDFLRRREAHLHGVNRGLLGQVSTG